MRAIMIVALATRCASAERPDSHYISTGIEVEPETSAPASTGEDPQFDLPRFGSSTGGEESSSTGGDIAADPTTGANESSTGGASSSGESTGSGSTSTSTGPVDESTSSSTGEPLTDCPCQDGADNTCDLAPSSCSATLPGGYCDPNGDGAYLDGDWTLGFQEYAAKCS